MLLQSSKSLSVPAAEWPRVGRNREQGPHMPCVALDLNLTSVKHDPENLGAVAKSDVCVGNSFGSILEELVDRAEGKLWGPALGQSK